MTLYQVSYRMFPDRDMQLWTVQPTAAHVRGHEWVPGFFSEEAANDIARRIRNDGGEAVVIAVAEEEKGTSERRPVGVYEFRRVGHQVSPVPVPDLEEIHRTVFFSDGSEEVVTLNRVESNDLLPGYMYPDVPVIGIGYRCTYGRGFEGVSLEEIRQGLTNRYIYDDEKSSAAWKETRRVMGFGREAAA